MAKVSDMRTVTFPLGEEVGSAEELQRQVKALYFDNGWDLFNTHFMGIAEHRVMMAYVFVKYEDEAPAQAESFAVDAPVAVKKRGRPAKVVETEPVVEE